MLHVITRDYWGAAPPTGPYDDNGAVREAYLHHTEDQHGNAWATFHDQCAHVRGIQSFHQNGRRWHDIGYHYVVFQSDPHTPEGRVFEGRPVHAEPAAQLGHNYGTLAIAVVGNGQVEHLHPHTRYLIEELIELHRGIETVGGHRDVTATECPGDLFYGALDRIAEAAGIRRWHAH